jgi:hypothetical protein
VAVENAGLALNYEDLRDRVAEYIYGGSGDFSDGSYTTAEKSVIDRTIEDGLRQFYRPPVIDGRRHEWSFLSPTESFTINSPQSTGTIQYDHTGNAKGERAILLSSSTFTAETSGGWDYSQSMIEIAGVDYQIDSRHDSTTLLLNANNNPGSDIAAGTSYKVHQGNYILPDDFGRLVDEPTFAQKDNAWYTLKLISDARIRSLRQRDFNQNFASSKPQYIAIRPLRNDATTVNKKEMLFWPDVTADATIIYRYRVRPGLPTSTSAPSGYLYGSSEHSDTILYSCMGEAELRLDGGHGAYHSRFMEALVSSISMDRYDNKSRHLGYNDDASDGGEYFNIRRQYLYGSGVSHKGTGS